MAFIELERKTDVLALAAFILALGSVLYQTYGFLRGSNVTMFAPEQVVIKAHQYPQAGTFVRFGARLSYVNTGQVGYNAMVHRETLSFQLGDTRYQQEWQEFQTFNLEDDGTITSKKKSDAHPMSINAGSAESHDTFFAPRSIRCDRGKSDCEPFRNFLGWEAFLEKLTHEKTLTFVLTAEFFSEPPQNVSCTIEVTKDMVERLKVSKINSPTCWPNG